MNVDVAAVGLGLVGSAALRYLADTDLSVVGIGPAEPDGWVDHDGPFASHYDSGRVTRRIDAQREWSILASRSIEQYRTIEQRSGIAFHSPVGHLFVRNDQKGLADQKAVAEEFDLPVTWGATADEQPGGLVFPEGYTTLNEPGPAGHIDPRMLVSAQLRLAEAHGAKVLRTHASSLKRVKSGFEIVCGSTTVRADQVLISTGAYGNDLLPEPLAMSVRPEAVILAEVREPISDMPSVIYLLDSPHFDDTYFVPPVRYPDGKWYLKMGGSHASAGVFETESEMNAWMRSDQADAQLDQMRAIVESVLPDLDVMSWHMKPCLITDTQSGLPYVDELEEDLFVALGGNGHAAKSSDALGALAANLVETGAWNDSELDQAAFAAIKGTWQPGPGSRHGSH